jgi:hypothetical protein
MKFGIDYDDLIKFTKKLETGEEKVSQPFIVNGLNVVGDGLISVLATKLAKDTGLAIEQVRGMMRVKRATRNDMDYDIAVDNDLLNDDPMTLEGRRESRNFGKQKPDTLVIIVTQKDDLVCMECVELEAAGPMPIEEARKHVPKHPHCRCIIMPYVQRGKRLPVTMTTMSGRDPSKRQGRRQEREMTLRQMAQEILDRTITKIKIELK